MQHFVRKYQRTGNGFKERLIIKGFKTSDDMHKFLNTADNALQWQEIIWFPQLHTTQKENRVTKTGTYAYAGGQWHNVKSLDPSVLCHV